MRGLMRIGMVAAMGLAGGARGEGVRLAGEVEAEPVHGARRERFAIRSPAMARDIRVAAVLPPDYDASADRRFPVLYALHGMGAPYDTWAQMRPLIQGLRERPMILVTFHADRASMYVDAPERPNSQFTRFFFEELIPFIERHYRADPARRGVTGFSMGGYGALHYYLERPEAFTSVSALSAAVESMDPPGPGIEARWIELIGRYAAHPERYRSLDVPGRLERTVAAGTTVAPLYFHVGLADERFVVAQRAMRRLTDRLGLEAEYHESEGGHNWPFWRDASAGVVAFHWRHMGGEGSLGISGDRAPEHHERR